MKQPLALDTSYQIRIHGAGNNTIIPHKHTRWVSHCTYLLTSFHTEALTFKTETQSIDWKHHGVWLAQPGNKIRLHYHHRGRQDWIHFTVCNLPGMTVMNEWTDHSLDSPGRYQMLQPQAKEVWGIDLPVCLPEQFLSEMQPAFSEVTRLWHYRPPWSQVDANGLLASLIHQWVHHEREREDHVQLDELEQHLLKAEHDVRHYMSEGINVDHMAEVAGYERAYFSVLYKERRGISPGQFIKQVKMEHAALLLRTQDLSIQVISQMVGYPNTTSFCRAFRQWFEKSPVEYRSDDRR